MSFFRPSEFRCKCRRPECDAPTQISPELLSRLDNLRMRIGRPLIVTSGLRCTVWNTHEDGKPNSEHLTGHGVDLACASSRDRWEVMMENFHGAVLFNRIGIGKTFIHFGVSHAHDGQVIWLYPQGGAP